MGARAESMAGVATDRRRPDRGIRYFLAEQTPVSAAAALVGLASLIVLVVGPLLVITSEGWTPPATLTEAIEGDSFGGVLMISLALGVAAIALGGLSFKRMLTKPSREAAVAGVVFGIQAIVIAALVLWFRAGEVEKFSRNFFDFALLGEFAGRFVRGAYNTLILALAGEAIGIGLGLVFAVLALSRRAVVRAPARIYINFFRGTPLLWQLSFFFFGIVLGLQLDLSTYTIAILVFGLNAAAYSAEIFRAGVQSIERGQFEAARGLGMTYFQSLNRVILPQAIRRVIPPLTNEFVILIKDTSLVVVLGLTLTQQELLSAGRDIYSQTFNATPFLASAAGYLAVTLPMIRIVNILEKRLRSGLAGIAGL